MASRLKTVQYCFPTLASMTNNTLTNLTQITVFLPEATKTFRSVFLEVSMDDIVTATGGSLTTKTIDLRLGAAAYTSTTNTNTLTNSGENLSFFETRDFTSHFTTNWTGSSMTCDVRMQINQSTGTTLNMVNVTAILTITYEYDDTATTQLKTVYIPLNAPVTTLPTVKTSHDTIPELRSYLPEANKVFRRIFIVTQANTNAAAATDHTVSYELSSLGVTTTGNYESALITDRWTRYVYDITSIITTTTTHTFNMWSSLTARHHTPQAWMVVTYEFNASVSNTTLSAAISNTIGTSITVTNAVNLGGAGTYYVIQVDDEQMLVTARSTNTLTVTRGFNGTTAATHSNGATVYPMVMNSLTVPMEIDSPMGGTNSLNYQQGSRELRVPEQGVKLLRLAAMVYWSAFANEAGLNARIGNGSFVAYTNTGSGVIAGNKGMMIRNDNPTGITFSSGRNELFLDIYNTSATQRGGNIGAMWYINYISRMDSNGHSAHNHSVKYLLHTHGTGAAVIDAITSSVAPNIPEANYYISALGLTLGTFIAGSTTAGCPSILVERLASTSETANGGLRWDRAYSDAGITDAEAGFYTTFAQVKSLFNRWSGDPDTNRLQIETARRYRLSVPNTTAASVFFTHLVMDITYHSIAFNISGNISGAFDPLNTVITIDLYREITGIIDHVYSTSINGDGPYSINFFDETATYFVTANDPDSLKRVSTSYFTIPAGTQNLSFLTTLPINAGYYGL